MIAFQNGKLILEGQPMDVNFETEAQNIAQAAGFAVQGSVTGTTIAGTIRIQSNIDYALGASNPSWDDMTSAELDASGSFTFDLPSRNVPFFKVKWEDNGSSSDAGITLTSFIKG